MINELKENYKQLEKSIVSQLLLEVSDHWPTTGTFRERVWADLFRQITPKKFAMEQGVFIIDAQGKQSSEVDLIIFDEQYTPYIFNYGNIKFIPIEAVAVVIQCKSKSVNNQKQKLENWCKSIDQLKTTVGGIARIEGSIAVNAMRTQPATNPIKILCALSKPTIGCFDIFIYPQKETLAITINKEIDNLMDAFAKFNGDVNLESIKPPIFNLCEVKKKMETSIRDYTVKDSTILSLIFQLNQLLMLINNPMLFPHKAYVDLFNKN